MPALSFLPALPPAEARRAARASAPPRSSSQLAQARGARELLEARGLPRLLWVEAEFAGVLCEAELDYVRRLIARHRRRPLGGIEWWRAIHDERRAGAAASGRGRLERARGGAARAMTAMIAAAELRKQFHARGRDGRGRAGRQLRRGAGGDLRLPRPQRRRQDDDAADAHDAAADRRRHRDGRRLRRRPRARGRSASGSATSASSAAPTTSRPGARTSCSRAASTAASASTSRARVEELLELLDLAELRRPAREDLLRRPAPPPRRRARDRPRARGALPRRADDRPRPAEPREPLGSPARAARPRARPSSSRPTTSRRPTRSATA